MRASREVVGAVLVLTLLQVSATAAHSTPNWAPTSTQQKLSSEPRASEPQAIPPAEPGGVIIDLGDVSHPSRIDARLRQIARMPDADLRISVPNGQARLGDFSIGSDQTANGHLLVLHGDASVYGKLHGNLVTVDGDIVVHPGGKVAGDVLALGGQVHDTGGEISGDILTLSGVTTRRTETAQPARSALEATLRKSAGVLGVFLTLSVLGFALVMFARQNLEIVSDTAAHSFGRALVIGILGQFLLVPTFGMLVVGLILSVVGVLLLPFVIVVYPLLVVLGIVGGYLAVAHAMGETYIRRKLASGVAIGSANSYRYLLVGLLSSLALWAAWALFGWVPIAGGLIGAAAVLVTWLLGTAGLGAVLLSRAGLREGFAGRLFPPETLTDEYLWATPQLGVTAGRRPDSRGGSPPSRGTP